jgi:hypothetical protein
VELKERSSSPCTHHGVLCKKKGAKRPKNKKINIFEKKMGKSGGKWRKMFIFAHENKKRYPYADEIPWKHRS